MFRKIKNMLNIITDKDRIEILSNITKTQCDDGNWNWSPYMHGMANGMILALSIMEDNDPKFLSSPKVWLQDRNYHETETLKSL